MAVSRQPPWVSQTPRHEVVGFKAESYDQLIELGYTLYEQHVLLFAAHDETPWRRYWVEHRDAIDVANHLAAEAELHLTQGEGNLKSCDLGLEDFIEHLGVCLEGSFH